MKKFIAFAIAAVVALGAAAQDIYVGGSPRGWILRESKQGR